MADLLASLQAVLADRYTIERELGRGGMAVVFLAHDLKHQRPVAIKVLRPELSDLLGRERFLREIGIAAGLQHPSILALYDSGAATDLFYYVMPFVEGESLRQRLDREKQLPLDDALHIAREVGEALAYAHGHGIVHRDIKPANILLSGGHALVADFGIARAVSVAGGPQLTERGIAVGTPAYMSPEQAGGEDPVDGRSDLYALGCVLYEMLAGDPPFTGRTAQAIMARQLQERPPALSVVRPTVPPPIQGAIETALAKVPADRFQTATAFLDALMTTRERRARVRRPRHAVTLPGVAVLAFLVSAWLLWRTRYPLAQPGGPAHDPTHIAVLYFDDLSGDQSLRYIANGLTQDLIEKLGDVRGLHVISLDGVRQYRGRTPAPDSIARALEVGTIIAGSVARSQNRLRVSVRMVDPATGEQLLSQTVDRTVGDIFAIQDTIAQDVSETLRRRLGLELQLRQQRATTKNAAAWDLVQRAGELREDASSLEERRETRAAAVERLWEADSLLQQAEALDHHWVVPILDRGEIAFRQSLLVGSRTQTDLSKPPSAPARAEATETEWLRRAAGLAERAYALSPDDAQVLELRGFLRYQLWVGSVDPAQGLRAEQDLRAAVLRDPGRARAWYALSQIQRYTGRFAEADQSARHALDADAYLSEAYQVITNLFFNALNQERFAEARHWCDLGRRRFPMLPNFVDCQLRMLGWSGAGEAAIAQAWTLLAVVDARDPNPKYPLAWADRRIMVAAVIGRSGLTDSAHAVLRRVNMAVVDSSVRVEMSYAEAYVHLLSGERDEALRLLSTFLQVNPTARAYVARSPWFTPLAGDPRFQDLVRPQR